MRDVRTSVAYTVAKGAESVMPVGSSLRLLPNEPESVDSQTQTEAQLVVRVVSSNRLLREGLSALLSHQTPFHVQSAAPDDFVRNEEGFNATPEVLVFDQSTDRDLVMQLVHHTRDTHPSAEIIVTGVISRQSVDVLVNAGVRACVMLGASPEELTAAISSVSASAAHGDAGEALVTGMARTEARPTRVRGAREVQLTPREQQVTQLIVDGMCNKEIAVALGVAIHTVKSHVHSVLQKLSVGSRLALAALVRRHGDLTGVIALPMQDTHHQPFRLAR